MILAFPSFLSSFICIYFLVFFFFYNICLTHILLVFLLPSSIIYHLPSVLYSPSFSIPFPFPSSLLLECLMKIGIHVFLFLLRLPPPVYYQLLGTLYLSYDEAKVWSQWWFTLQHLTTLRRVVVVVSRKLLLAFSNHVARRVRGSNSVSVNCY